MAVTEVVISEDIRQRLGDDGLADLTACLWAADCQSCGRLLGDDPPSLCIDDVLVFALASLHHQQCRVPAWNDSMIVAGSSGEFVSFVTRMVLLPLAGRKGGEDLWPMMVINPGLECVELGRGEDGRWRVRPDSVFAGAGLLRPGPALRLGEPVEGAVARVTDSVVAVTLQVPPFSVYEANVEEEIRECARRRGGVLVGVTHAVHPGQLSVEDLQRALADPRMLAGWVAFHGSTPQPGRTAPAAPKKHPAPARGDVCVLHWTGHHLSVGKVAGRKPARLDAGKARAWAGRVIGKGVPVQWAPARKDRPEEGWFTRDALSARQYFLRRYPDGWKLILAYSQASGPLAETDNEAKAWAGDVLRFQTGLTGLIWEPGPGTPGSVTLYARVG